MVETTGIYFVDIKQASYASPKLPLEVAVLECDASDRQLRKVGGTRGILRYHPRRMKEIRKHAWRGLEANGTLADVAEHTTAKARPEHIQLLDFFKRKLFANPGGSRTAIALRVDQEKEMLLYAYNMAERPAEHRWVEEDSVVWLDLKPWTILLTRMGLLPPVARSADGKDMRAAETCDFCSDRFKQVIGLDAAIRIAPQK